MDFLQHSGVDYANIETNVRAREIVFVNDMLDTEYHESFTESDSVYTLDEASFLIIDDELRERTQDTVLANVANWRDEYLDVVRELTAPNTATETGPVAQRRTRFSQEFPYAEAYIIALLRFKPRAEPIVWAPVYARALRGNETLADGALRYGGKRVFIESQVDIPDDINVVFLASEMDHPGDIVTNAQKEAFLITQYGDLLLGRFASSTYEKRKRIRKRLIAYAKNRLREDENLRAAILDLASGPFLGQEPIVGRLETFVRSLEQ